MTALGLAIKEHGVDIATAVDTESAIYQRANGADVYIVGGWRYTPFLKWYGSKHITDISKLRGGKIGVREVSADGGGLVEFFIEEALKEAGIDPQTEVEQVQDPVFGYRNNPAHIEMLRSGKVNAITSSPACRSGRAVSRLYGIRRRSSAPMSRHPSRATWPGPTTRRSGRSWG